MIRKARITRKRLYQSLGALIRSNDLVQNFGTDLFDGSSEADQELMAQVQQQAARLLENFGEHLGGKV